jgi:hypothetical protein
MMFLMSEKSVLLKPGPMTMLRLRLPKRMTSAKADISNQRATPPMIMVCPFKSSRNALSARGREKSKG